MSTDLIDALEWQERALCAQTDPEAFFPEKGGATRDAKRVCLACPVRVECLKYALDHDERFGIWGGLSERERRRVAKQAVTVEIPEPVEPIPGLTERQAQIFHLRANGLTNVQIADDLCVTTKTVEWHLKTIRDAGVELPPPPSATSDRPEVTWDDCGTGKALARHQREHIPPCQACLAVKRANSAAERAARKAAAA